jgi:hypothetical protein
MKMMKLSALILSLTLILVFNKSHADEFPWPIFLQGVIGQNKNKTGDLLFESLANKTTKGRQIGGEFGPEGWTNDSSGHGMLIFDLGKTIQRGVIEFDVKGFSRNMAGGYDPGDSDNRGYYFSLYDESHGDKGMCYGGLAFIEVRLNIGSGYSQAIKFQGGPGSVLSSHYNSHCHPEYYIKEVTGSRQRTSWNQEVTYHHKIIFGDGKAQLYIDDKFEVETDYTSKPVGWRYIYLGRNNYKGGSWNGPASVTFSNLKVNGE